MASICNYSHPEQQTTEGIVHHKTGSLFPYNPEFYELASGLYGPGPIYCWYLLLASVVVNWFFHEKVDEGYIRPGISNDLLAALAYPTFAATDALIHAIRLVRTEYRGLAYFCLRFPKVDLTGFAKFNDTQLDLRHIPPDILSLGQHVIDITGPLTICYMFAAVMSALFILDILISGLCDVSDWRPTKWAGVLICVTYGYFILILTIFHLSLGNIFISLTLTLYEASLPFMLFVLFGTSGYVALGFVAAFITLIISLIKKDKPRVLDSVKLLVGCLALGAIFPGLMIICVYANGIPLLPDLAISMGERDQIAALIGGIVTLGFTLNDVYRSHKASEEGEAEE